MEIKTKFNINQIVQHKYQRGAVKDKTAFALEVIEITNITCSAGTQNFYKCRILFAFTQPFGKELVDIGFSDRADVSLREDELKEAPQGIIDILENKKPESIND